MWFLNTIIVVTCSFIAVSARELEKPYKDAIGFPEVEENVKVQNKQNRTPVFLPSMCREDELYYPGDQKDDWICDCRPGYLYHPSTNKCWPAYRQGPCQRGHFLVLPNDSPVPTCYINPCMMDTLVIWNGKCEILGSTTPCESKFPPSVLWVNATNLVLDCMVLNSEVSDVNRTLPKACPPGCKRSIQNNLTGR
ncbi:uncharacterized protein [Epargyreus clarus]|uniref:uncharacterized protein isoform X2 n=1 Tax=Epargyreus clarus TaxID=520877 RepID=UPI003C2FCEE8